MIGLVLAVLMAISLAMTTQSVMTRFARQEYERSMFIWFLAFLVSLFILITYPQTPEELMIRLMIALPVGFVAGMIILGLKLKLGILPGVSPK